MSITSATSTSFIVKLFQIQQQRTTLQKKIQYIELQVIKDWHLLFCKPAVQYTEFSSNLLLLLQSAKTVKYFNFKIKTLNS
jgi:hypothetical protein